jgi:hypothetical protein
MTTEVGEYPLMPEAGTPPGIEFRGERLAIRFDRFDIASYDVFLRAKRLPEYSVEFDPESEGYTITAPARFAAMLGIERPAAGAQDLAISGFLYDDQQAIVRMGLDAKRFAIWSDCGLGKTLEYLEWARHVIHRTGGRVLITTMNEIVNQVIDEARTFYGSALPVHRIESRREMREWCKGPGPGLAITNYEKWNPEDLDRQVVTEARHLAGIVLDESSRLKTGGGKQKWAIIKSCRGIEYKLSCTATPAPNDVMEFASQASFLEKMRSEGEILWTYFTRDPKTHRWTVRPHARAAFFEFMSTWSIYVRDPKKYGWRLDLPEVPRPETIVHEIAITPEQREQLALLSSEPNGQLSMFDRNDTNAIQRGRLSQVAKGFRYRKKVTGRGVEHAQFMKGRKGRMVERIPSHKPGFVADLIRSEAAAGLQVLVWTVFDAEGEILADLLGESLRFDLLTGSTKEAERIATLDRFRRGETRVLISRASMLGYGMNFQHCGSMIFSGFNDSYEQFYQAIRRAYRHGQLRRVRVHLPVIPELEGDMLENLWRKQGDHEASISEMERNYITASRRLRGVA